MLDLTAFRGQFGDFETLALDTDLDKFVFCIYGPDGGIEAYKMIVGWTQTPSDILLHVIDVEGTKEDFNVDEHIKEEGIQFVMLRDFVGPYGCEIHKDFQAELLPDEDTTE